jgi:hypothetical protein
VTKATELSTLLESLENEIGDVCAKPLKEMNVSDKIKLAKLLIAATKKSGGCGEKYI